MVAGHKKSAHREGLLRVEGPANNRYSPAMIYPDKGIIQGEDF